jgi:hypothetical protein
LSSPHTALVADACAAGIRVKSGWAAAVLIGADAGAPRFLHRARLALADPKVPKSAQPYHRGFGKLQKNAAIIERLTGIVHAAAAHSLADFCADCVRHGHRPRAVALVVGSTIDPERVTNEHIRAHAYEARLFRTALERAAAGLRLPCSVTRERDIRTLANATLGAGARAKVDALATVAGRPWRADEKLACLAAWIALA